jgi:hypothetical protein
MCSRDKYAYLTGEPWPASQAMYTQVGRGLSSLMPMPLADLPWYVSVLVDLSYVQGPVHGPLVAAQLIDVAVRADSVRDYAVKCMLGLLLDGGLFIGQSQTTISNVLFAAGWIVGEYSSLLPAHETKVRSCGLVDGSNARAWW